MSRPYDPNDPRGASGSGSYPDHDYDYGSPDDDTATRAFSQVPPEQPGTNQSNYGYGYTNQSNQEPVRPAQGQSRPRGDAPVTQYEQAQAHITELEHDKADLNEEVESLRPFKAWAMGLGALAALLLVGLLISIFTSGANTTATIGEDGAPTVTETSEVTTTRTVDRGGGQPPVTETETQTSTATETQTQTETQVSTVTVTPTQTSNPNNPGGQDNGGGEGVLGGLFGG